MDNLRSISRDELNNILKKHTTLGIDRERSTSQLL